MIYWRYTKNEKEKEELDNLNLAEPPFLPDPRTFVAEENGKIYIVAILQWEATILL